ncbi:sacsin N-terminal ATP-binding-like domain-containing protein [Winogradskyella helgolandensis]|uniref:sacsin N-terminal ATP-binding-like domain-containing protein n=1 Tax=Winogradskyella helgolandensis TaxID=2697010 RepID=UPI0015B9E1EF|nr:hypothetical protein [Winogradskyella helgolandensis]
MLDKETIQNRRSEFAEELHAGSVFRDIQAREKERKNYEKRWFWELLQNAKDSTAENGKVSVKIEVNDESVAFSHSGNPFKLDEILSLIIQGSSKIDDDTKTGRFGTGFMTTYLLSKKVKITGELTDNDGFFEFSLNRDADNIEDFFRLQTTSNDEFITSLKQSSYLQEDEYQTRFLYEFDGDGKKTCESGLMSLNELIPFTQLFNTQIDSITLSEKTKIVTYSKSKIKTHEIDGTIIEEWELTKSDESNKLITYIIREDEFDIVLVSQSINGVEELLNITDSYPKLFFTFPLIGTEEFGIPFIINSTKFDPKIERDGIYLNSSNNQKNQAEENKKLITNALSIATPVFAELVKKKQIKSVYNLYNFSCAKEYSWLDTNWFSSVKNKIIADLKDYKCIPFNKTFFELSKLKIPFSHKQNLSKEIWSLMNQAKSFNTISIEELENWIQIFKNFAKLKDIDIYEIDNIVGSKYLINYLSNKLDLANLEKDLHKDSIGWLNKFYKITKNDLEDFPLDKSILLNQQNHFKCAKNLSWDKIMDDELSWVSILLELDFPMNLISNELNVFNILGVDDFNVTEGIDMLKNKLNQFDSEDFKNVNFIQGNALFIKWLIKKENVNALKDTKIISLENNSENAEIISKLFPISKHLLLTPKDYFKEKFPLYAELIREKDCMHPIFDKLLVNSDFEWLESYGFINCSPLVKRTEKLDTKTIELLISNPDDLSSLKDEEGKIIYDIEMEYSDFAYLTTGDGHIYDRNSSTSSSLKIFNFLLNEATSNDVFFNSSLESKIINNEKLKFSKMLWLQRAKNNQWVNVKNIEPESSNRFSKEVPSSKNLSELIKHDTELVNTIRGENQISFLSMINVGVSDLIRNTLPSDEVRVSWDKALTNMITSNVDPELVEEIFKDHGIQEEYNNRLKKRKIIKRNQNIGYLVEELFKELINKLKSEGVNIDIERKPFGSDYLLTDESSDLVEGNSEVLFQINDWLIELKATGKDFAAMTSLQAENAVKYKENYALIVVPLDGPEPDLDYVRDNAKVVTNIGYKLEDLYNNFSSVEKLKDDLMNEKKEVSVSIENQNIRFRINSTSWQNNHGVTNFLSDNFAVK